MNEQGSPGSSFSCTRWLSKTAYQRKWTGAEGKGEKESGERREGGRSWEKQPIGLLEDEKYLES